MGFFVFPFAVTSTEFFCCFVCNVFYLNTFPTRYFPKTWYAHMFCFLMPANVQKKLRSENFFLSGDRFEKDHAIIGEG
jgi:hypothetical protein